MSQCTNCPNLQAQIVRLQIQVSILERVIAAAQRECITLANEAGQPMPKGVARGIWAHAKGMREGKGEAAGRVLERLKG